MRYLIKLMLVCAAQIAHAADPFIGTWRLQPTTLSPDVVPSSMIIEISQAEPGIHYRSETTSNGRTVIAEYTANYDEQLVIVTGNRGLMAPVKLKRIDEHIVEATYVRAMQVVARSRRVLSPDESTMTITTETFDAEHHATETINVYERLIAK